MTEKLFVSIFFLEFLIYLIIFVVISLFIQIAICFGCRMWRIPYDMNQAILTQFNKIDSLRLELLRSEILSRSDPNLLKKTVDRWEIVPIRSDLIPALVKVVSPVETSEKNSKFLTSYVV